MLRLHYRNTRQGPRPSGRRVISMMKNRILMLLVISATCAMAQVGTASIRGAVTDPSGAVVPSGKVLVKNVQTGVTATLATDTDGRWVAPTLPIGSYDVQVQAQGFET